LKTRLVESLKPFFECKSNLMARVEEFTKGMLLRWSDGGESRVIVEVLSE